MQQVFEFDVADAANDRHCERQVYALGIALLDNIVATVFQLGPTFYDIVKTVV
jgi:hypothetical protein